MAPQPKAAARPDPKSDTESGTDSSSESEASNAMSEEEIVAMSEQVVKNPHKRARFSDSNVRAIHVRSRVMHKVHDTDSAKLACGRKLNNMYRVVSNSPNFRNTRRIYLLCSHSVCSYKM